MLNVTVFKGPQYVVRSKAHRHASEIVTHRSDYIRFEYDDGVLEMKKAEWDKLTQAKKKVIYKLGMTRAR